MLSLEHLQLLNSNLKDRRERKDKSNKKKQYRQLKIIF